MIKLHVLEKRSVFRGLSQFEGGLMKSRFFKSAIVIAILTSAWAGAEDMNTASRSSSPGPRLASNPRSKVNNLGTAEELSTSSSSTGVLSSASGIDSIYGYLEFRPSYTGAVGELHSENTAEAGYKLKPNIKLGYVQYYSTNFLSNVSQTQGLNLAANDGFFQLKAKEFWKSSDKHWLASYSLKLLTPTDSVKSKAGFVTAFRNEFKMAYAFNSFVTTDLTYIPILNAYSGSGFIDPSGTARANAGLENEWVLNSDLHFTPSLTLSLPLIYKVTNYRDFAGATNSGRAKKNLVFWPELDYDINPTHTVGISYYTDNCISAYGSGLDFSSGFKSGVAQLIWGINL
jgi:hypothetical protein